MHPAAHLRRADRRARRGPRRRLAAPAASRASASRPATSSARCGASPGSGSTTPRARSRRSTRSRAGSGENLPESGPATIVHGDYRLGNVMYTGERLSAIFDWELATIGDPLADIGYLLATYAQPGDPPSIVASLTTVTRQRGLPDPRRARRPLRGALGPGDDRRALVHDARAVEVGDLPRGLLQAPVGGINRRPVLRPPQGRRARDRRARASNGNWLNRTPVHWTHVGLQFRRVEWEASPYSGKDVGDFGQGQGCSSLKEWDRWRCAVRRTVSRRRRHGLVTGAAVNSLIRRTRWRWSLPRPNGPVTGMKTRCACCTCSTRTTSSASCCRSSTTSTMPRTSPARSSRACHGRSPITG